MGDWVQQRASESVFNYLTQLCRWVLYIAADRMTIMSTFSSLVHNDPLNSKIPRSLLCSSIEKTHKFSNLIGFWTNLIISTKYYLQASVEWICNLIGF